MKFLISTLLGLHAVSHVVGFVWPWWGQPPVGPASAGMTIVDDAAMRSISMLWLATGVAFWAASIAHAASADSWRMIAAGAASASLVLSVACLPASLPGIPINVAIISLLRITAPRQIRSSRGRSSWDPSRLVSHFPARRIPTAPYHFRQICGRRPI